MFQAQRRYFFYQSMVQPVLTWELCKMRFISKLGQPVIFQFCALIWIYRIELKTLVQATVLLLILTQNEVGLIYLGKLCNSKIEFTIADLHIRHSICLQNVHSNKNSPKLDDNFKIWSPRSANELGPLGIIDFDTSLVTFEHSLHDSVQTKRNSSDLNRCFNF